MAGCAAPTNSKPFVLSDDAATDRLLATHHVAALARTIPAPLICFVEGHSAGATELYLGEDHPDHTVRLGAYRVTADGRVWVNADPTLLDDRWMPVD